MTRALRPLAAFLVSLAVFSCATTPSRPTRRDEFPLDPREELSGPFAEGVDQGTAALLAGDSKRALEIFARAREGEHRLAAEVGWIEAAVLAGRARDAVPVCEEVLARGEPTVSLLVGCGEARAGAGDAAGGFDLYRRAVARTSGRPGIEKRAEDLKDRARAELVARAREQAAVKDFEKARGEIARAIALAPRSAEVRIVAGEIEASAGDSDAAIQKYREALELSPRDSGLRQKIAEMALESRDFGLAVSLYDELARSDPQFRPKADEARLAFRVANWPAPERDAARAERLTRAAAASLVWWMFPEVREARVSSGVIASDVVGRRDSRALARALSLGLLEADRETHRANPDALLGRFAAARLSLRLLLILRSSGGEVPCLEGGRVPRSGAEAVRVAESCGILESEGSAVTGPEFTRALDRVRALAATETAAD